MHKLLVVYVPAALMDMAPLTREARAELKAMATMGGDSEATRYAKEVLEER